MDSMQKSLLATPGILLAALTDLPFEWFDPGRVARPETDHGRPDGQTWAVVRDDDQVWRLYAPGAPDPTCWPEGDNPWRDATPAAIFDRARFPHAVNLDRTRLAELADLVGTAAGGVAINPIEGIRWANREARTGHPVVYVRVLR